MKLIIASSQGEPAEFRHVKSIQLLPGSRGAIMLKRSNGLTVQTHVIEREWSLQIEEEDMV